MARTKQTVVDKHRSAQQAASSAGHSGRKRGPINIKAARIMCSQEVAALPPVKRARSSQSEEGVDSDDEEAIESQVSMHHASSFDSLILTTDEAR